MRTAVDTNIISALWSREDTAAEVLPLLAQAFRDGGIVICGVVYAELLAHPKVARRFVDEFLERTNITIEFDMGEEAWRDAARRFGIYAQKRRRSGGGDAKRLIADFMVGAHAKHHADRLMTLDGSRYKTDFPELPLMLTSPSR